MIHYRPEDRSPDAPPIGAWRKPACSPTLWDTPLQDLTRKETKEGYIMIRVRPGLWEAEHRMVLAQMLGRPLKRSESAHHRNGVRSDNRPENLELWVMSHRGGQRASESVRCPHCGQSVYLVAS